MRAHFPLSCVLAIAVIAPLSSACADDREARPNVLMIAIDDLGCTLGCYGHPVVLSPNIDRLAARSLRFERAYCQYPVCNPSRTSLLTGLRPDDTRIQDNNVFFRDNLPEAVTLPQLFRDGGYYTACVGKIFHGDKRMEDARSWDHTSYPKGTAAGRSGEGRDLTGGALKWCRWLAADGTDEDQPDGQSAAEAIALLEQHADQPFFLAVGFHKPHDPFVSPAKYFANYAIDRLRLPVEPADRGADVPLALVPAMKREFAKFTDRDKLEFMRAYFAGISFTDAQVGKLLDALDRLRLSDRTIVILWGDHGYHVGERGWWNKNTLFELSARAPMLLSAPGMKSAGKSTPRLVEFVDIYPTLADLCGLAPPANLAGMSLRPLLDDSLAPTKPYAITQVRRGEDVGYSVRDERFRYTEWNGGASGVELYDHDADEGEYRNLAELPEHRATVERLRGELRARTRSP